MTLTKIEKIEIPKKILDSTFDFLRRCGAENLESHALWVGNENDYVFRVSDVWFPKQYNSSISYEVPEDEVHRINVRLNELKLVALVQVHTHPAAAFHSETDNEGSSLSLPGSFSVVIPDYGFIENIDFNKWIVFRYYERRWNLVQKIVVRKLFQVI